MRYWKVLSSMVDENHMVADITRYVDANEKPKDYVIDWTRKPIFAEFFDSKEEAERRVAELKKNNR